MEAPVEVRTAINDIDFSVAKSLILEYVEWLGIDLSFQNFDDEMKAIKVAYSAPRGGLFIAYLNEKAIGVAGIKRFSETTCEVKRMYVQPLGRRAGVGRLLLNACIECAKGLQYKVIKLDTADFMKSAIKLYTENGFVETKAYRHNPHEHARYFELVLEKE